MTARVGGLSLAALVGLVVLVGLAVPVGAVAAVERPPVAAATTSASPSPAPSVLAPLPEEDEDAGTVVERSLAGADDDRHLGLAAVLALVAVIGAGSAVVRVLLAEPVPSPGPAGGSR